MATCPRPVDRWRTTKVVGKVGMQATSAGMSIATQAMGVPNIALIAAGTAASANGIGLLVTGAALTVGTSLLSFEEKLWLLRQEYDVVKKLLAAKLKST